MVFAATGAEASNKVALAAGKESVIEVLGLKLSFWALTPAGLHLLSPAGIGSPRFWGKIPPFLSPQPLLPDQSHTPGRMQRLPQRLLPPGLARSGARGDFLGASPFLKFPGVSQ